MPARFSKTEWPGGNSRELCKRKLRWGLELTWRTYSEVQMALSRQKGAFPPRRCSRACLRLPAHRREPPRELCPFRGSSVEQTLLFPGRAVRLLDKALLRGVGQESD